jgi:hypothetical protein
MPYTPEQIDALIRQAQAKYNLGNWFRAQLHAESGLDPNAINQRSGAAGIGQFMPATARGMGIDPMNPQQAIEAAALYNRQNLNRFGGDVPTALAAYNWGPGNVSKHGVAAAPAETQRYIAKIIGGGSNMKAMQSNGEGNMPVPPVPPAGDAPPPVSPGQEPVPGQVLPPPDLPPVPGAEGTSLADILTKVGNRARML